MQEIGDWISLFIVLFVFFIPVLRKVLQEKHKKQQAARKLDQEEELYLEEEEQEEELFFEQVEEEEPLPEPPPPEPREVYQTQRLVRRDYALHSEVEARAFESQIKDRQLETHISPKFREEVTSGVFRGIRTIGQKKSHIDLEKKLSRLTPRQRMVVHAEILNREPG